AALGGRSGPRGRGAREGGSRRRHSLRSPGHEGSGRTRGVRRKGHHPEGASSAPGGGARSASLGRCLPLRIHRPRPLRNPERGSGRQRPDPSAPRPRVGRVRRGWRRFDRAERYDGRARRLGRVREEPGGRGERLARPRAGGPGDPDLDPPRRSRRDPYLLREGDRPGPGKGGSMKEARVLPKTSESESLHRRALGLFPGGVNSPVRAFQGVGGTPRVMVSARGAVMRDADGNQLLDYVLGWGPLLLGHAHADVVKAVERQAREGTLYGATTPLEIELADRVQRFYPAAERLRFVSSGTEAAMSALRLARAATKRNVFVKLDGCYHGHADPFLIRA